MAPILITDLDDPRIAGYRDIRERDLTGRQGLFVAEGEVVLRVLVSGHSRCRPRSLLLADNRVAALGDIIQRLDETTPVYCAPQAVLDAIAGFHLHRGMLALGEKPSPLDPIALLESAVPEAVVLAACGIGNHDNMGGLFRNAAAFGAHAVLLDDRCCDPFYRKAIRVSVGAVLRTPMASGLDAAAMIAALHAADFEVLALSPAASDRLEAFRPRGKTAILLGSEGPGLPPALIARCRPVAIPMAGGFDSLNVATAGAIALHHLTRRTDK
jgi:tRNA G18 (ribose-2'-O)-methylase SpoU